LLHRIVVIFDGKKNVRSDGFRMASNNAN
jgi:hypothetical protein